MKKEQLKEQLRKAYRESFGKVEDLKKMQSNWKYDARIEIEVNEGYKYITNVFNVESIEEIRIEVSGAFEEDKHIYVDYDIEFVTKYAALLNLTKFTIFCNK